MTIEATKQLKMLGLSYDWKREVTTCKPDYYKWTQWIFLQLFNKGLAYKKEMAVNWCTSCKCVLANEEVVGGVCERCGSEVVHKVKSQWMLKITEYAQRLIDDLDEVDYIERVKTSQKNWIGRSVGAEIDFHLATANVLSRGIRDDGSERSEEPRDDGRERPVPREHYFKFAIYNFQHGRRLDLPRDQRLFVSG